VQEALILLATVLAQPVELVLAVDAFGDHFHVEHARHAQDQISDRARGVQRGDERAIDFQGVDAVALKIGEVRVAGAKVVDGDAEAGLDEALERAAGLGVGAEQHRFGDLQFDVLRVPMMFGKQSHHCFDKERRHHLLG